MERSKCWRDVTWCDVIWCHFYCDETDLFGWRKIVFRVVTVVDHCCRCNTAFRMHCQDMIWPWLIALYCTCTACYALFGSAPLCSTHHRSKHCGLHPSAPTAMAGIWGEWRYLSHHSGPFSALEGSDCEADGSARCSWVLWEAEEVDHCQILVVTSKSRLSELKSL